MKKRIISSLCAVALVASATASWGAGFLIENTVQELTMTGGSATSQGSNLAALEDGSAITVNVAGSAIPGFLNGEYYDSDPNHYIRVAADVVPDAIGTSAETPYALAGGYISSDVSPDGTNFSVTAIYQQFFTLGVGESTTIAGIFNHHWLGDGYVGRSKFTDLWALYATDVNGNILGDALLSGGGTFWGDQALNGVSNDNKDILVNYQSVAGGYYLFQTDASVFGADPVPEPGTFILAGSGLVGIFMLRRRSRKA